MNIKQKNRLAIEGNSRHAKKAYPEFVYTSPSVTQGDNFVGLDME
jgi:hypothetical protein